MEDVQDLKNAIKDHQKVIKEHQKIINDHSEIIMNLRNELGNKQNKMTMEKFQSNQTKWFDYFTLWMNNFQNVQVVIDTENSKRRIGIYLEYKNKYFATQYYKIIVIGTRKLNYEAINLFDYNKINYETLPEELKHFVAAVVKDPVRAEAVFRKYNFSESEDESEDESD